MQHDQDQKSVDAKSQVRITAGLIAFGLAILVFLISIDHERWFKLRPASGTAAAMFYAAHPDSAPTPTPAKP